MESHISVGVFWAVVFLAWIGGICAGLLISRRSRAETARDREVIDSALFLIEEAAVVMDAAMHPFKSRRSVQLIDFVRSVRAGYSL